MTLREFANLMNHAERGEEDQFEGLAKENNFVYCFGASDDLLEIRGAVNDEVSAWGAGEAYFTSRGLFDNQGCEHDEDGCQYFLAARAAAKKVVANWDTDGWPWLLTSDIPHEEFVILEDGQPFCRGLVFALDSA